MIKQSQDVLQNIFQKAFKLEFGEICDNCELLRLWITKFAGIKPVFPVFTVLKGGNFPPHLKNPRPMGRGFVRWGGKNFSARFARPAPPLPHLTASRLENPPHLNFRLYPALILHIYIIYICIMYNVCLASLLYIAYFAYYTYYIRSVV